MHLWIWLNICSGYLWFIYLFLVLKTDLSNALLILAVTFNSKPGGQLNDAFISTWTEVENRAPFPLTHSNLQYARPLSPTRNNVSVRCCVRDLKLLTVTDDWVQRGVEGTELNIETVWKLQFWREKMRPLTYGCPSRPFKMWRVTPAPRYLQQRPVISANDHHLKWTGFFSPDWDKKKSSLAHR